ncbi:hypothetical protein M758_UG239000 [Ceratodon purpureus]|nr:hypothetical protein M758_UG239000 [Ceratodon purpureus]
MSVVRFPKWQIVSSFSLGSTSSFVGTALALADSAGSQCELLIVRGIIRRGRLTEDGFSWISRHGRTPLKRRYPTRGIWVISSNRCWSAKFSEKRTNSIKTELIYCIL